MTFTDVSVGRTAWVWPSEGGGDVLAVVNAGRYRLFQCVDGAGHGLIQVVPEGGQLREVGRSYQHGPIIVFKQDRIGEHQSNPKSFLILATRAPPQLLSATVHRQLAGAVSEPDREMSAASLVGMEGAALPSQPASQFSCVHPFP